MFLWYFWKCGYTQLEAATIDQLLALATMFMFGCSGTQIYDHEVKDEGSGQPHNEGFTRFKLMRVHNLKCWWKNCKIDVK